MTMPMAKRVATLLAATAAAFLAVTVARSQDPAAAPAPAAAKPAADDKTAAKPAADDKAAAKPGADKSKALATFKGGAVTIGELEDAIARQSPFMRRRYTERKNLEGLLDKTIRFELLAQEAERRGEGKDDTVVQAVKQNAVQQLMRTEFDEKLSAEAIPEADVQAYYESNQDEYLRPATRRASHIMVATEEEAKALLAELKGADLRAFRKLARDKSIDEATKMRGGDLRYFDDDGKMRGEDAPSVPGALAKAAFALKDTGDISPRPIKVEGGYSVVMLTGQRPAMDRKLKDADVQQSIRVRLWRQQRQDAIEGFVAKLREQYKPELHADLIDSIKLETTAPVARGPGVPEGFPYKPGEEGQDPPEGEPPGQDEQAQ